MPSLDAPDSGSDLDRADLLERAGVTEPEMAEARRVIRALAATLQGREHA